MIPQWIVLKKAEDFFGNDYARVFVSWYRFRNTWQSNQSTLVAGGGGNEVPISCHAWFYNFGHNSFRRSSVRRRWWGVVDMHTGLLKLILNTPGLFLPDLKINYLSPKGSFSFSSLNSYNNTDWPKVHPILFSRCTAFRQGTFCQI